MGKRFMRSEITDHASTALFAPVHAWAQPRRGLDARRVEENAGVPIANPREPDRRSRLPRIWFVNRFFWPDYSATSQILSDLAFGLAREGAEIAVICSRGRYDDPQAILPASEHRFGVEIHRVIRPRFGRGGFFGRAVDGCAMYAGFASALAARARRGDIVVAKSDPPLLGAAIAPVARALGLQRINWLQDLYPEVALGLGVKALRPFAPLLYAARDWSLRGAFNVTVGEAMAERVARRGVGRDRVTCIPNWSDERALTAAPEATRALREAWGLTGKFVLGYCGNLGRAHEFDTLLDAAERLRGRSDIAFLLVGGGHLVAGLKREVERRGLGAAFRFEPYQPSEMLAETLSAPDAHWISLRPEMEGLIVPSKFYSAAAAGRPIVAVVDRASELSAIVRRCDCGLVAAPGDGAALAAAALALADDPGRRTQMGANARAMIEREFPRERAFEAWRRRLEQVARFGEAFAGDPGRERLEAGTALSREGF
jgi:glycosyltransferase involved in cell wall biosynthesis